MQLFSFIMSLRSWSGIHIFPKYLTQNETQGNKQFSGAVLMSLHVVWFVSFRVIALYEPLSEMLSARTEERVWQTELAICFCLRTLGALQRCGSYKPRKPYGLSKAHQKTLVGKIFFSSVASSKSLPEPFDTIVSVSKIRYFCLKVSYRYRIGIDIPGSRKYQYSISIEIF